MLYINDISNYDWPFTSDTIAAFRADREDGNAGGYQGVIIGSQNPAIARMQAAVCRANDFPVIATYTEPFKADDAYNATLVAIEIAKENGSRFICAACEDGGITGIDELRAVQGLIYAYGLTMVVYCGQYYWQDVFQNTTEFRDCPLWYASYFDDRRRVQRVNYGGWTKVAIHQFASTPYLGGRDRDRNVLWLDEMEPDDMTEAEVRAIAKDEAAKVFDDNYGAYFLMDMDLYWLPAAPGQGDFSSAPNPLVVAAIRDAIQADV